MLHEVLPHGIAELIFDTPQDYGALQLKVSWNSQMRSFSDETIDYGRQSCHSACSPAIH